MVLDKIDWSGPISQTMHETLAMGLADLKKIEGDPKFKVNMACWVTMLPSSPKCLVCLAGAILVSHSDAWQRLISDRDEQVLKYGSYTGININPCQFLPDIRKMAHTLNYLSFGEVWRAVEQFYPETDLGVKGKLILGDLCIPSYKYDTEGWWKGMWELYEKLKAANL